MMVLLYSMCLRYGIIRLMGKITCTVVIKISRYAKFYLWLQHLKFFLLRRNPEQKEIDKIVNRVGSMITVK